MYKLVEWSPDIDLTQFYQEAAERGFLNNSSQERMIDTFMNEKEFNCWILYYGEKAIGSVLAHSFDEVTGPNTYRVLTRVCSFGNANPLLKNGALSTPKRLLREHQNFNDQFFLPKCIEWVNGRGRIFASSNESAVASQRLVHTIYFPFLESIGAAEFVGDIFYRGVQQSIWEIHPKSFFKSLNKYPRWIDILENDT